MRPALFALLIAACAQTFAQAEGQVLIQVPAGADPRAVMEAAREAFAGRKWAVSGDAEGALVARIRGLDIDSTLKVFLAGDSLRYIDNTVERKGAKGQVPERWLNYLRSDLRRSLNRLAPPAATDPAQRLSQLKTLLDRGLITQAEYDAKRAEILKGL